MKEVYESMLGGGFDAVFRSRKAYKYLDWGERISLMESIMWTLLK